MLWAETRDVSKHPMMHRIAFRLNYPARSVNSAEAEKSFYTQNNSKSALLAGITYIWQLQLFNVCIHHLFMYLLSELLFQYLY